ncbi:hypothetical protein GALL_497190 [mine drainage metagenome]|uniref:Uncharacterized protein n=1 Tax=mine drainage metagenome TaxID=410659 RepID=A0A1J5PBI9_9ZZZZ
MPCGSTATKVWAENAWSSPNARIAAFCPAASPSNRKMISPPTEAPEESCTPAPVPEVPTSRRTIRAWSGPNAVPHVATAVGTPERCAAMTSV